MTKPLSPRAKEMLLAYRRETRVPAELRATLLQRVELQLQQGGTPATLAVGPARATATRGRPWRLVGWSGALVFCVAGIALWSRERPPLAPPTARDAPMMVAAASAPPQPTKATERAAHAVREPSTVETRASRALKPRRVRSSPPVLQDRSQVRSTELAPVVDKIDHSAPPALTVQAPAGTDSPEIGRRAHEPSAAVSDYLPYLRAVQAAPRAAPLDEEVMQMRTAYDHLRAGAALRALSALSEHARRFPEGKLAAMREAVRVQALCELGRVQEARTLAGRFLAAHGSTPYAARVSAICAPQLFQSEP